MEVKKYDNIQDDYDFMVCVQNYLTTLGFTETQRKKINSKIDEAKMKWLIQNRPELLEKK